MSALGAEGRPADAGTAPGGRPPDLPERSAEFSIRPGCAGLGLVLLASTLTLVSYSARWWVPLVDPGNRLRLGALFDTNGEQNFASWYSSSLLLVCALLLAGIGFARRARHAPYARHWLLLGAIFAVLSLDETATIHEIVGDAVGNKLVGAIPTAWTAPGALFAGVVGVVYRRFLLSLPPATRVLLLVSGAVYVLGAVGMETMGLLYIIEFGKRAGALPLIRHLEEFLEMLGLTLFVYSLLAYTAGEGGVARFRLG